MLHFFLDVMIGVFTLLALMFGVLGTHEEPGGVNTNGIILVPAALFALIDILVCLIRAFS